MAGAALWMWTILVGFTALAEVESPLVLPMGDKEALMGNAGVAVAGSPANIFYNPAGLDQLSKNRFSASGSTYAYVDGRASLGDEELSFGSLATVPNMLVFTRKIRSWNVGFGIFVPVTVKLEISGQFVEPDQNLKFNVRNQASVDEQYIGIASGRQISRRWRFGAALFLHRLVKDSYTSVFIDPSPTPVYASIVEKQKFESLSLFPVVGLQNDLTESLQLGLRVAAPNFKMMGRTQFYSDSLISSGGSVTRETIDREYGGDYKLPTDVVTGLAWQPAKFHRIVFDVGVQFPVAFQLSPGSRKTESIDTATTVRQGLGYEYRITDAYSATLGWSRSPWAGRDSLDGDGNPVTPDNWNTFTAGFYDRAKTTTTGVGVFYGLSRQDAKIALQDDGLDGVSVYGVLVSSSIDF